MLFQKRFIRILCKFSKICKRHGSTNVAESSDVKCSQYGAEFTNKLYFTDPSNKDKIPIYRLMNQRGQLLTNIQEAPFTQELATNMYKCMVTLSEIDKILYESQRQGRISFYMTSTGEEGTQVGSSAGLNHDDLIYGQYRELGALMWRGFTLEQIMNQCYGNEEDWGKGKQMPVHYGSRLHNFVTVSSPLTTQLPQAAGSAYAYKIMKNKRCVLVYFGEGAASEGDAHAGFNFAATLECPVIFFCRNNGYAISTPVSEQYKGDGIAGRAAGYGITAIRVDGNDTLAVYNATVASRRYVLEHNRPVVLEALTYRRGHHSTSDDSSAYRCVNDVKLWQQHDNPINRLKLFLNGQNWWNEEQDVEYRRTIKNQLLTMLKQAEKLKKPEWEEMFNDVYYEMPDHLMEQCRYMKNHLNKYKQYYPMEDFKKG